MDKQQDWAAKAHLVACMQQGQSWQRAADHAGVQISQSNAYRLWRAFQQHGEMALRDGRHGHPRKLRGEVRTFLEAYCRKTPQTASSAVQIVLQEQFNLNVSISQINRVRILVTTHRGDQHLTIGLPALLTSYEQAADLQCLERVVVDREGMAAELLATLASQGRTVVTVLRTDQYAGLESLREVGEFVPLRVDRQGKVIREVALARFSLPLPEHPGPNLDVRVALIRDLSRQIPNEQRAEDEDGPRRWDEKPDGTHENWLDANWQATPMKATPTVPKLIPIVTTAPEADAVELAQTYTRRWPAQENAIRDWLIPLGIDVNHGFAGGARKRMHNASKLYVKRCKLTKERTTELYCTLTNHQIEMERQGVEHWLLRKTIKEEQALADAEIEEYQQRQWKAYHTSNVEYTGE